MSTEGELWHIVEAKRDDGTPTMFRIRELAPRPHLNRIFVVEMPYPATEMSRLPSASAYRRLADFDEQWLRPACAELGWELVGSKTEDGSFFLYMYGAGEPNDLIARLSPFDAGLGFYDDSDPGWLEYGTLRELLDQAKAIPQMESLDASPELTTPVRSKAANTSAKPAAKPAAKSKPAAKGKPVAKTKAATKSKPAAKRTPVAKAKAAKPVAKAKAKPATKAKPAAKKR